MDCCSTVDPLTLSYKGDAHYWCPICGAEWLSCGMGLWQKVKEGRTEPMELHGIRIPE